MSKTGKIAMPTQGWLYVLTGLVVALFLTLAPFAAQAQSLFTGGGSSDTETTETTPEAEANSPRPLMMKKGNASGSRVDWKRKATTARAIKMRGLAKREMLAMFR